MNLEETVHETGWDVGGYSLPKCIRVNCSGFSIGTDRYFGGCGHDTDLF